MNSGLVPAVQNLLSQPVKIAIIPHINPDGDAIGSSLGLMHYLKNLGHDPLVIAPNDYPEFLKWMPGNNEILIADRDSRSATELINGSELIFTLDFNDLGRCGILEDPLRSFEKPIVMIDHHQQPLDYATVTYSDPTMSSTCEMVYNLIEALGDREKINKDIATCLYAGIITDTGSFKYASTTSRTHHVAANLIEIGAESEIIHQRIFDTNPADRLALLGVALRNLKVLEDYNTAYITLSRSELEAHNFKKGYTEGFVNYALSIAGVRFAAIFIENTDDSIIKISLRSSGRFSVNDFARSYFNGGGHVNAAGGRSELSLEETAAYFEQLVKQHIKELTA